MESEQRGQSWSAKRVRRGWRWATSTDNHPPASLLSHEALLACYRQPPICLVLNGSDPVQFECLICMNNVNIFGVAGRRLPLQLCYPSGKITSILHVFPLYNYFALKYTYLILSNTICLQRGKRNVCVLIRVSRRELVIKIWNCELLLLLLWAINSRASLHLQWLQTLCCLWLICLLCLSARQTWPGWRIRRPMPSWGRGRRSGWRRRTPRRNRSAALFGWWGYKYELCHHGGLRALLCKICGCIPVFLSGATKC